jgi:tRNA pseudouridine13 synthase
MSAFTVYPGSTGEYWFPTGIPTQDREALRQISLPTAATKMEWQLSDAQRIYGDLLRERGLQPGLFNRFPLRHAFFKSIPRPLWLFPQDLTALMADDELYPEKHKLQLSYTLPRGSYATMVVKRLFSEPLKKEHP